MTATRIVLLTEEPLTGDDADRITALHEGAGYRVLVPADTGRNLLIDVLDHLSLLDLAEALRAVRGHEDPTRAEAAEALAGSLAALRAAGVEADGEVVTGDPVAALEHEVAAESAPDEIIVVTRPHAVEDTFHRDWASRARERLGLPVLHVYAGSSWIG